MVDGEATVEQLKALVLGFSRERDWEQFHHPKDLGMALASEVGELLDHFRFKTDAQVRAALDDPRSTPRSRTSWPIASGPCSAWPRSAGSTWPPPGREGGPGGDQVPGRPLVRPERQVHRLPADAGDPPA